MCRSPTRTTTLNSRFLYPTTMDAIWDSPTQISNWVLKRYLKFIMFRTQLSISPQTCSCDSPINCNSFLPVAQGNNFATDVDPSLLFLSNFLFIGKPCHLHLPNKSTICSLLSIATPTVVQPTNISHLNHCNGFLPCPLSSIDHLQHNSWSDPLETQITTLLCSKPSRGPHSPQSKGQSPYNF